MKKKRPLSKALFSILVLMVLAFVQATLLASFGGCDNDSKKPRITRKSQVKASTAKTPEQNDGGKVADLAEQSAAPDASVQKIEKRTKSSSRKPQKPVKIRTADLYATVQIILVSKQGEFIDSRLKGAIDVIKDQLHSQSNVEMKELREATSYSLYKQIKLKIKKDEGVPVVLPNGKRVTFTNIGVRGKNPQIEIKTGKYNNVTEIKPNGLVFGGLKYNNSYIILFIKAEEAR